MWSCFCNHLLACLNQWVFMTSQKAYQDHRDHLRSRYGFWLDIEITYDIDTTSDWASKFICCPFAGLNNCWRCKGSTWRFQLFQNKFTILPTGKQQYQFSQRSLKPEIVFTLHHGRGDPFTSVLNSSQILASRCCWPIQHVPRNRCKNGGSTY